MEITKHKQKEISMLIHIISELITSLWDKYCQFGWIVFWGWGSMTKTHFQDFLY
jgi:hypothetical protein